MDAELAALCSAAATTLVALMTTDSWKQAKAAFTGLWRRHQVQLAALVEADLEAAAAAATAARQAGDGQATEELTAEWGSRLRRLVEADEQAAAETRRLVEQLQPFLSGGTSGPVVMIARASGGSRVNQAGHDQTVSGG